MHRSRIWIAGVVALAGCSLLDTSDPTIDEGDRVEVTDYDAALPTSRQGYVATVTFVTPEGGIQIVSPGTGPEDPPVLLRTLRFPGHAFTEAQIADDGYLWVATPDFAGGTLRIVYVVDPHAATVHRVVELPQELRSVAALSVGPDQVYLRAWRDGFSGGIGVVSRACATATRACDVRFFAELGNVGLTPDRGLYLEGNALVSFNSANSRDNRFSTVRFDRTTGAEVVAVPFSGNWTYDDEHFFLIAIRGPGIMDLIRLDKATLAQEQSRRIDVNSFQIAHESGRLYVNHGFNATVEVYDAATLDLIETVDVSAAVPAGRQETAFDFFAPGVLMLSHRAWLNTVTNEVVADAFPLTEGFSQSLRFPQGHPRAY